MSWNLTPTELAKIVSGNVVGDSGHTLSKLCSDSRKPMQGDLFIALKGDAFDGHDFLEAAINNGAGCLLVHRDLTSSEESLSGDISVVKVGDTLSALQNFAHWWREECGWKVVGITGSNGKTTTKDALIDILSDSAKVQGTQGNFNNHWGVPFTLLEMEKDIDFAVVEMGMSAPGEITRLCEIAEPDVVVCTMVGHSHMLNFKNLNEVAAAKREIYEASPKAKMVFNIDNEKTIEMHQHFASKGAEVFTFSSFRGEAHVLMRAMDASLAGLDLSGRILGIEDTAKVSLVGRHNISNIGAAAASALALGLAPETVWRGIRKIQSRGWGRNQLVLLESGQTVLFDAYNANPESMSAAVKMLYEQYTPGKKVMILGDMLELGEIAQKSHENLGEAVGNSDIEIVWYIGDHARDFEAGLKKTEFGKTYFISDTYEEKLAIKIGSMLDNEDIVVIKGSRGMKLEQVLHAWKPKDFK